MSFATLVLLAAFQFPVPSGWTDLSKGVTDEQLQKLPPEIALEAQATNRAVYAVDLSHLDEKALATFTASVLPASPPIDFVRAKAMAEQFILVAERKGETLELVDAVPRKLGTSQGARLRFVRTDRNDRMDVFIIPTEDGTAILTFLAPLLKYDSYEQVFVDTAERSAPQPQFTLALKAIAFASVLLGAALGAFLLRRRRKKRQ